MAQVSQNAVLICVEGWGVAGESSPDKGNAILNADTPWMNLCLLIIVLAFQEVYMFSAGEKEKHKDGYVWVYL
ncbi:hypothetical protein KCV03_g10322, partial [Aureobasidium melanogenum]